MKTEIGENRLKSVLNASKKQNPERMKKIIKSELYFVLKNYFEIGSDDITLNLDLRDEKYILEVCVQSDNIILANTI